MRKLFECVALCVVVSTMGACCYGLGFLVGAGIKAAFLP